jgi:DnaK suppressor protein
MDETDIDEDHFRQLLERRKAELEKVSASGAEARKPVELDQTTQGRLSRIDAIQGQEMSKAAERRRKLELQRIQSAFKRLEEGEYGYCVTCGETIGRKRLEVDPASPTCIDCAEGQGR